MQSVAAIQFSLYEQNENGLLDEISLEFQLKPGETFQVVGLNDEYWDYFMGDQLPEEQLGQLKSGNACIVRNPIPMSYGEDVLEFTNIEAGESICVAGMELNVLKTLDGYDGYLGIGNGGFTNGVQVIVDDAIYERLTGKDTYSEFLPTLNEGADRENFDTFIEAFCNRIPGTTFLSYEETDQQLKESFAQIQMLAWGLILFVGLIGILNIINTVYTNIHTRVTEIGMQRAIGMSAGTSKDYELYEGLHEPIIDQEQWDRVKAVQSSRNHASVHKDKKLMNPFATILFCEKCGAVMKRNVPAKTQNTSPWYRCPTRGCNCRTIKCDFLEAEVVKAMSQWWGEYTIKIKEDKVAQTDSTETALSIVREQLTELQLQQDKICEYLEKGIYTIEMFTKRNDTLTREIHKVQAAENELLKKQGAQKDIHDVEKEIIPTTQHILDSYPQLSVEEKNRLWKIVMERITAYRTPGGEVSIHIYPKLPMR